MVFKSIVKKICAAVTIGAVTFSFMLPIQKAEALSLSIGDLIGIGATAYQMKQIQASCKALNYTDEGRKELYNAFRKEYGVNDSPEYNRQLDRVMKNLSAAVAKIDPSINDSPYMYFVSNDASINAACGMGHVMMVNFGTFVNIPSEDEIAAIVGHEMGHGQKNHVYNSIRKKQTRTLLAGVAAAATNASVLTQLAGQVALMNVNAHSDKKNEKQADDLSMDYMLQTDYNPGACAAVMQRFVDIFGKSKGNSILNPSDHPDSESRRDKHAKTLYEYSGKKASAADGLVKVNNKDFCRPAATSNMSGAERSYFVLGNLAKAFHNGQDKYEATVKNGTVMLGSQEIFTPARGDESAEVLAARLNSLK